MAPHPAFPSTYVRYMDDSFCLFRDQAQLDLFLAFSNIVHSNLMFTKEEGVDYQLLFLDVLVTGHPTRETAEHLPQADFQWTVLSLGIVHFN